MENKEDFGMDPTPDQERPQTRQIMEINPNWPWWQRLIGNLINASGTFMWATVTIVLIYTFNANPELVGFRNALLNVVVPAIAYGILSLIAGITLFSWLNPWFSPLRIMQTGDPLEKAAYMVMCGLVALALAIVVAGVV